MDLKLNLAGGWCRPDSVWGRAGGKGAQRFLVFSTST